MVKGLDFSNSGDILESGLPRRSHIREQKSGQQEMVRLKLLEQAQAVWMLMLAVNKKEPCRTNIQLSSEISTKTPEGPNGTVAAYWHVDNCISFAEHCVYICLSLGRNSRDLSSVESGKLIQSEQGSSAELEVLSSKASVGVGGFFYLQWVPCTPLLF